MESTTSGGVMRFLPPIDTPGLTHGQREVIRLSADHDLAEMRQVLGLKARTVDHYINGMMHTYRDSLNRQMFGSLRGGGVSDRTAVL